MDLEKIKSYSTKFDSTEIQDADTFEKDAIDFRNQFVELKYDTIQSNFDLLFKISFSIASHYRPIVQTNGCDCLYVICDQAAPAQIKRVAPQLRKCFDQLIQVGNSEVMPALLPAIERSIEFIFESPSSNDFHQFFLHYLETWSREATTPVASFSFSKNFSKILKFVGLATSRYLKPAFAIIQRRLFMTKSKSHTIELARDVLAICQQTWPVVKSFESDLSFLERAKEICNDDNDLIEIIQSIDEILAEAPKQPSF